MFSLLLTIFGGQMVSISYFLRGGDFKNWFPRRPCFGAFAWQYKNVCRVWKKTMKINLKLYRLESNIKSKSYNTYIKHHQNIK